MSGLSANQSKLDQMPKSKQMVIQKFKGRLRENIKTLSENFSQIIVLADDNAHKNLTGKMTEFYTVKSEMAVRAQLMVRAADELLKLTADLKEFLILHDFQFLTQSIKNAEQQCDESLRAQTQMHNQLETEITNVIYDLDREISDNFYLRH